MDSPIAIGLIVVLLVGGIAVSGYFQVREKAKAELRQKTNQFLYRVRQTQDFLDRFAQFQIGIATKTVLLKYIQRNLKEIEKLDPTRDDTAKWLESTSQRLDGLANEKEPTDSSIPKQSEQIIALMSNYKKLMLYIQKLGKLPFINTQKAKESLIFLKGFHRHLQSITYISTAKQAIDENKMVLAKQYLENAKKVLLTQNISDERTQMLLDELQQLEEAADQELSEPVTPDTDEGNTDESDEGNVLFQPKKKW